MYLYLVFTIPPLLSPIVFFLPGQFFCFHVSPFYVLVFLCIYQLVHHIYVIYSSSIPFPGVPSVRHFHRAFISPLFSHPLNCKQCYVDRPNNKGVHCSAIAFATPLIVLDLFFHLSGDGG